MAWDSLVTMMLCLPLQDCIEWQPSHWQLLSGLVGLKELHIADRYNPYGLLSQGALQAMSQLTHLDLQVILRLFAVHAYSGPWMHGWVAICMPMADQNIDMYVVLGTTLRVLPGLGCMYNSQQMLMASCNG